MGGVRWNDHRANGWGLGGMMLGAFSLFSSSSNAQNVRKGNTPFFICFIWLQCSEVIGLFIALFILYFSSFLIFSPFLYLLHPKKYLIFKGIHKKWGYLKGEKGWNHHQKAITVPLSTLFEQLNVPLLTIPLISSNNPPTHFLTLTHTTTRYSISPTIKPTLIILA